MVYDVVENHRANNGHARQLEEDLLAAPQTPLLLHALVRLVLQERDGVGDVPVELLKQFGDTRRAERLEAARGEGQRVLLERRREERRQLRVIPGQTDQS